MLYDYFLIQRAQRIDAKRIGLEEVAKEHVTPEGDGDSDSGIYGHDKLKYSFEPNGKFMVTFQNHNILYFLDEDSEYIEEDREVEIERTNKAARHIQQCIMQELQTVIGLIQN